MKLSGFLLSLIKEIVIPIAIIVTLIGAVIALRWSLEHPLQAFCEELPQGALMETVIRDAEASGFIALRSGASPERLDILNHEAPFFRLACECEFSSGALRSKRLLQAD
ncbi:hypothetical protein [Hahella chejuensis]|nr:hypothetical protein [Hahella chejuensis]